MIDKETYKKELVRMWDSLRDDKYKGGIECHGVDCNKNCALYVDDENGISPCCLTINAFETIEAVEKWSKEHPPKKHKVSQLEYDILKTYSDSNFDYYFNSSDLLMSLLSKGYFDGATISMRIIEYFNNCEVKENDDN